MDAVSTQADLSDPASSAPPFGKWERMLAGRYLRAKRKHGGVAMISVIAFLGIMLAVMVLIVTMSVMNGFREVLVSRLLGVEGHAFVTVVEADPAKRAAIEDKIRAVPGVQFVSPIVEGQALATAQGQAAGAMIRGVSQEALAALFANIQANNEGRSPLIGGGDLQGFNAPDDPGVVIGSRLGGRLDAFPGGGLTLVSPQGAATPFGIAPRSKGYRVQAWFSLDVQEYDDLLVYMPIEEAKIFLGQENPEIETFEVRISDPDDVDAVRAAIVAALNDPGIRIATWKDQRASLVGALNVERSVMRLILMMIVAIAALNIISGLVMLVKNKSRDIAILRTMGATQGAVLRIFFMTGATVGFLGAMTGLILGVLFCAYIGPIQNAISAVIGFDIFPGDVYTLDTLPARLDWAEVALVAGWAFLMSMAATIPPAWRASRLDPVEALRNE
jgi:lipoprotein-releasing system permease protein